MLNLCIIFGGKSSEHEVSIMSARSIYKNINRGKYRLHMIKIEKSGGWSYLGEEFDGDGAEISIGDLEKYNIDVVFPVLHGKFGEDGTIQGLFEIMGIPYVGSGVVGSAVCMDKCVAKLLFESVGIPKAAWVTVRKGEDRTREVESWLGFPCFVKPANAGSSVGVSKVKDIKELRAGIAAAFEHDDKVLVEKAIKGREIECSVMGNVNPVAAEVLGEIVPANEFYDYEAKYQNASSKLIIPADLPNKTAELIKEYAIQAYKTCECKGLARVDFFVTDGGRIYLNEINTMPGFTDISMYPKLWIESGLQYSDLIDKLIELARE